MAPHNAATVFIKSQGTHLGGWPRSRASGRSALCASLFAPACPLGAGCGLGACDGPLQPPHRQILLGPLAYWDCIWIMTSRKLTERNKHALDASNYKEKLFIKYFIPSRQTTTSSKVIQPRNAMGKKRVASDLCQISPAI